MKVFYILFTNGRIAKLIGLNMEKAHKKEQWNILKIIMDRRIKLRLVI